MSRTGIEASAADADLYLLLRAIDAGDEAEADRLLRAHAGIAAQRLGGGASRADADRWFLAGSRHHLQTGDTALHIAAGAHRRSAVARLVAAGADVAARNRMGAQPLHLAADGPVGGRREGADVPALVVDDLVDRGADVDALDKRGVSPLHRAVRSRSTPAVAALLSRGADALLPNGSGSTPLHLAVQTTGASGSGSASAQEAQAAIVALLLEHGADPSAVDGRGRTAREAASARVRDLL